MKSKSKKKKTIKNFEFSKLLIIIVVIVFSLIAIWSMTEYYQLIKLAIESDSSTIPDATLPVTCVGTILGAVLSYCLYQGALKSSLNKNKLTIDKTTGEIKSLMENDFLDAVDKHNEEEE